VQTLSCVNICIEVFCEFVRNTQVRQNLADIRAAEHAVVFDKGFLHTLQQLLLGQTSSELPLQVCWFLLAQLDRQGRVKAKT
jgi:hypothetical protein